MSTRILVLALTAAFAVFGQASLSSIKKIYVDKMPNDLDQYLRAEITKQFIENPFTGGQPAFDVILGGGNNQFQAEYRLDKRDLLAEFQTKGFRFLTTATALRSVNASTGKLLR